VTSSLSNAVAPFKQLNLSWIRPPPPPPSMR
jgi:hypothetical protein